jgi:predicted peroxiredoxin
VADKQEKLILMCTHGPEDTERATIPFVLATAAQASGMDVVMGFQVNGVMLITKGCAEHVFAPGFPPLKDLLDAYIDAGGKLYACGPCVQSRKLNPATDFIAGAEVRNAAFFVKELSGATNALVY